eukprot:TRINITY_DN5685_c0_g1_i1.p1 TRINITY_DN5685_c0_g1~~TRINITY_DN5685_c0_g1_i1.p1  ORF type:complete len:114 (+),score=22.24 TRINITY_DN5685_c0_g1_i1:27-344(+)
MSGCYENHAYLETALNCRWSWINGNPLDPSQRDANIARWADVISSAGIPWMYWQIIPNKDPHYGYDFEIGVNDQNWNTFQFVANKTTNYSTPFNFSLLLKKAHSQ